MKRFVLALLTAITLLIIGCAPKMETEIVLEPDISSITPLPENSIADTIAVIEARLNSFGIKGAIVKKQDDGLIVVQLPKVEDMEEVIALITSKGELDFREQVLDAQGQPVLDEEGNQQWVIAKAKGSDGQEKELTGKYLKPNARAVLIHQQGENETSVYFELNEEGTILFEQITQRNFHKLLGIFLDDKLISMPRVDAVIKYKGAIPVLSLDEAKILAIQLNSGVLPLPLRVVRIVSIGKD
jgi:preprotein translocase subunit SecD